MADEYFQKFKNHDVVYLEGAAEYLNDKFQGIKPDFIIPITKFKPNKISTMHIKLNPVGLSEAELKELKENISQTKGKTQLYLHFFEPSVNKKGQSVSRVLEVSKELAFAPNKEIERYVAGRFGENSYWYKYDIKVPKK